MIGETTVSLTIAPGEGPITGILEADGERVEFAGWIELAALIEERRPAGGRRFTPSAPPPVPPAAPPAS